MGELRFLITGGCGFIGSALIKQLQLCHPGSDVCVVDSMHHQVHGQSASIPPSTLGCEWIQGSVETPGFLADVVSRFKPTTVYHLAAETGTGQSHDLPVRYVSTNVTGTAALIEAIRDAPSVNKVILAGSRAVYGEGAYVDIAGELFFPGHRRVDRLSCQHYDVDPPYGGLVPPFHAVASVVGHPTRPASVYAASKLMQEQLLSLCGASSHWSLTLLRLQNVYGRGQSLRNPYTGVPTTLIQQLQRNERVNIFEDGTISRDFVHVEDVSRALAAAATCSLPHGTIIDIGSGINTPLIEIAQKLKSFLPKSQSEIYISHQFRPGDIRHAFADVNLAQSALSWRPIIDIDYGLKDFARWASSISV